jgi:Zn-dependent peptidase ImmA (M78 family)/DNA-binding XRE family transcriptional regulator
MFIGERLKQARELRGFTQKELARRVGVSQGAIAHFEGGFKDPSSELLSAIGMHLRLPVSFFSTEPAEQFSLQSILFRAHASMTRREAVEATRHAEMLYEIATFLRHQIDIPPPAFPELNKDPIVAARETRAAWNLSPEDPIPNLCYSVEKHGGLILALPVTLRGRDAFSLWTSQASAIPVIALSSDRPGDRLRFSMAHELGHLIMLHHRSIKGTGERDAYSFAGEFLMPERAIRCEIRSPVTLSDIAGLKPRWKVSMQALIRRAYDLTIISERHYRYLFEQMGRRGWRVREPVNIDIPTEKPRALRQMAELLYGKAINYSRLAADLHLTVDYLEEIMQLYARAPHDAEPGAPPPDNLVFFKPKA